MVKEQGVCGLEEITVIDHVHFENNIRALTWDNAFQFFNLKSIQIKEWF
jgi:hypothetical protein